MCDICYCVYMKRIPLSIEEQENLKQLFEEYRRLRMLIWNAGEDIKVTRDQIIEIYKYYGIKEKKYNNKLFKLCDYTYYKYPASCKNHKDTIKNSIECIKMFDI